MCKMQHNRGWPEGAERGIYPAAPSTGHARHTTPLVGRVPPTRRFGANSSQIKPNEAKSSQKIKTGLPANTPLDYQALAQQIAPSRVSGSRHAPLATPPTGQAPRKIRSYLDPSRPISTYLDLKYFLKS